MSIEEAFLLRAKLHWRCGIRRVREDKTSSGITTIYDAMLSSMRWYILKNLRNEAGKDPEENVENERFVFFLLRKEGLLPNSFNLVFIENIVDKALMEEDVDSDKGEFVRQAETVMTKLAALPFDESELPPEDPSTF